MRASGHIRRRVEDPRRYIKQSLKQHAEWAKCIEWPQHYINNYSTITSLEHGKVPFRLYPFQYGVVDEFLHNRNVIMLKPRQMGLTTLVAAYVLWFAQSFPHSEILIISIKGSVAKSFLRKMALMWEEQPDFLRIPVINGNKPGEFGSSSEVHFANGSVIKALPATPDAGRSDAAALVVMDEMAFQRHAARIWGAIQPTTSTGGRTILLSTAYGMGNTFYQEWDRALQRLNGMRAIQLHWRMHPKKTARWYREQKQLLGRLRTAQEIDCDFLQSGQTVFDIADLLAMEADYAENPPIATYTDKFRTSRGGIIPFDGTIHQFELPRPGVDYFISADVSEGTGRGGDFSAFSIFYNNADGIGEEVACFKGKLNPGLLGELLYEWGLIYNTAWAAPERNGVGQGPIQVLQMLNYPRIYKMVKKVRVGREWTQQVSDKPGWETNTSSRSDMIAGMDLDLQREQVRMRNPFFAREGRTFIYNAQGKPIAAGKESRKNADDMMYDEGMNTDSFTDDSIFGGCIGNEVRKTNLMHLTRMM